MTEYNSSRDTKDHIGRVQAFLLPVVGELQYRAVYHDESKLSEEEKPYFDMATPLLADVEYGSEEYYGYLELLKPALDHHYAANRHHPQHFENGIQGMNLIDVLEMLADWIAASERTSNGDVYHSIEINADRFDYSEEFTGFLRRTADWMIENQQ